MPRCMIAIGLVASVGLGSQSQQVLARGRQLQQPQLIGGVPPEVVQTQLCDIGSVFSSLLTIKNNADCAAGCARGTGVCPTDWYPSEADECSADCGRVFEPFCKTSTQSPRLAASTYYADSTIYACGRGPMRCDAVYGWNGWDGRDGRVLRPLLASVVPSW